METPMKDFKEGLFAEKMDSSWPMSGTVRRSRRAVLAAFDKMLMQFRTGQGITGSEGSVAIFPDWVFLFKQEEDNDDMTLLIMPRDLVVGVGTPGPPKSDLKIVKHPGGPE